ncbi:MAG: hypothetical protein OXF79_10215 [Chloroflexi bacterium]|nr:hypothetical protein [Chloroflexota bacterium]
MKADRFSMVLIVLAVSVACGSVATVPPTETPPPTNTPIPPTPTPVYRVADCLDAPPRRELLRNPDKYALECLRFQGTVADVNTDSSGFIDVWIIPSGGYEHHVVIGSDTWKCFRDEGRVLVDDIVTVYAAMAPNPYQYESVGAGILEVPLGFCVKPAK